MPTTKALMTDHWYGYECMNGAGCPEVPRGGVVLDLRLPGPPRTPAPVMPCPACSAPMSFRGYWPATEGGYGSRADGAPAVTGGPCVCAVWAGQPPPAGYVEVSAPRAGALRVRIERDGSRWVAGCEFGLAMGHAAAASLPGEGVREVWMVMPSVPAAPAAEGGPQP